MGKESQLLFFSQGAHRKRALTLVFPLALLCTLIACVYPNLPEQLAQAADAEAIPQESLLPLLETEEDALTTLGLWDDVSRLQLQGMTMQEALEELGYDADRIRAELDEIGEAAIQRYGRQTDRLIRGLFGDDGDTVLESSNLGHILPSLESEDDVFKALGVWEDALPLLEQGLTPQQTALELGFDADIMLQKLIQLSRDRARQALYSEQITEDTADELLDEYENRASRWAEEIFHEAEEVVSQAEIQPSPIKPQDELSEQEDNEGEEAQETDEAEFDITEVLPDLSEAKDMYQALGVWDEAQHYLESGLSSEQIAIELGYDRERLQDSLMEFAEERILDALDSELIAEDEAREYLREYEESVTSWVNGIFPVDDALETGEEDPQSDEVNQ